MLASRPRFADRLRGVWRRTRALLSRRNADTELSRELAFHLEMETENNIQRGMDPASARRAAIVTFGGVSRFSEEVRDVRNIGWLDDLLQDLRHTVRGFRRSSGFTAAAVLALSLGIGANTAVFSVVYGVVIAPLPYADPDRLVRLWESNPAQGIERSTVSPGTFMDLRERTRTLENAALIGSRHFVVSDGTESWESRAAIVSPALFDMLGVRPVVGRVFPRETGRSKWGGSEDEIVIGYRLWQQRFAGDPNVIGRAVRMDVRWTYTIAGVMPPGFTFPEATEIWTPLVYGRALSAAERQYRYYDAVAKLRPDVTVEQAVRDAAAIASQLEGEYPASNAGWSVQMAPLERTILGNTRPTLLVLLGLAACVLLIACSNVATLAVARATSRQHEASIRVALGAGRRRLLRQWAAEGLLLAALGGAGGLVVAYWSSRLLLALAPADIPRLGEVVFGGPALAFVLLATLVAGALVVLAPSPRARNTSPLDALRTRTGATGLSTIRTREWLVGAQVALTFVLIVASALLLRSFERLRATDVGFRRHDIVSAEFRVPGGRFTGPSPWLDRVHYYDRLLAEVARLPGVRSVGGSTTIPLTGELSPGSLWRTDAPGAHGDQPPTSATDQWKAAIQLVTPRYFETMGIPLLRGRTFAESDRFTRELTDLDLPRSPGVAVINEAMAKRFWPDGNPLGSTIRLLDDRDFAAYRTIVGVVRDIRAESMATPGAPTIFLPFAQHPGRSMSLVVRSDLPAAQLVSSLTDRLRAFDSTIGVASVRPLDAVVGDALVRPRFTMVLAGSFAVLALVIASVGVFGVVGFLVTRRTAEIGIRIALGAPPVSVLWLVLRDGLRPVVLGVAAGSLGAVAVAMGMRALLYELAPLDVVSFAASAVVLLVAAAVAAIRPARRAVGVDPLQSLRSD
ncbi:MAG: hypothetical protein K0S86_2665 [Geminicoccaceae bacterium]|nr:hypothetical protein [Geminicoccaceae bacterium]